MKLSRRNFFGIIPGAVLLSKLKLTDEQVETIAKAGDFEVFYYFRPDTEIEEEDFPSKKDWILFRIRYKDGIPVKYFINNSEVDKEKFNSFGGFEVLYMHEVVSIDGDSINGYIDQFTVYSGNLSDPEIEERFGKWEFDPL